MGVPGYPVWFVGVCLGGFYSDADGKVNRKWFDGLELVKALL